MNIKETFYYLMAGLIGILFGGIFLGLVLDQYFAGILTLDDMASWIGAISTLAAAIGTVGTLVFAVRQNRLLREEQRKEKEERIVQEEKHHQYLKLERKKREEHERKQQEIWAQQQSMFKSQQYEKHFDLFERRLASIEIKHNNAFKFKSTVDLYKRLFPNNSFEKGICLERNVNGLLKNIRENLDWLTTQSKTVHNYPDNEYSHVKNYLRTLHLLVVRYIGIEYVSEPEIGDIKEHRGFSDSPVKIVNVLSIEVEEHIADILNNLSHFVNEEVDTISYFGLRPFPFQHSLISFAFTHESGSYLTQFNGCKEDIQLLLESYNQFTEFSESYTFLMLGFQTTFGSGSKQKLENQLNEAELAGVYSDFYRALNEDINNVQRKISNPSLSNKLLKRLNELGYDKPIDNLYKVIDG